MTKIIGVIHSGYNTVRNISSLPFTKYRVEKKIDFFKFPENVYFKITGKTQWLLFNLHQDFGLSRCDIFHFFNTLSFGRTPWVTTFESRLPRFAPENRYLNRMGCRLMARKECKKLIAFSECSKKIHLRFLKESFPEYSDLIANKITVILPSQRTIVEDISAKPRNSPLSFIMVGSDFFRKGGREVLNVFNSILQKYKNVQLYIVSSMNKIDTFYSEEYYKEAMKIIAAHPSNIFYYPSKPNHEVLEMFQVCHVSLLPTYNDTFGYAVLEAQSCGCPVITTAVRSLPEINNEECGWVMDGIPKDECGQALPLKPAEKQKISGQLEEHLHDLITDIIEHPETITPKALKGIERIKNLHSPVSTAGKIEKIYDEALG